MTLTWSAVSNALYYRVYGGTSPQFDGYYSAVADNLTATTFHDGDLVGGTTYYYGVYAILGDNAVQVGQTTAVTTPTFDGKVEKPPSKHR